MPVKKDPRGLCSPEEERALALRIRGGDAAAREELILRNTGLIAQALKSISRGLADEDLFSEGYVALIEAVDGYDVESGYRFSSYAVSCIRGVILNALKDAAIVSVGKGAAKLAAAEDLVDGRRAENVPRAIRAAAAYREAKGPVVSLSMVGRLDDREEQLGLVDRGAADPCADAADSEERDRLLAAMAKLLPLHAHVLWRRAGFRGAKETLAEIGLDLGLSTSRVGQVERAAYAKLAQYLGKSCAAENVA